MKLEFLPDGSRDCPLIRLYSFDTSEAVRLRDLVDSLASGSATSASLHKQPWIEPIIGCELDLCVGKHAQGIKQLSSLKFKCVLGDEEWADIAGLLEPFCESDNRGAYQWLIKQGKVSFLLSSSGTW